MSRKKLQKVKDYLDENLAKGFIKPSSSSYTLSILFVLKKSGSLRFYVDYRRLNTITKKNRYPIPLIQEIIARLVGIRYFTRFDLVTAFNNLRMHPDSQGYITFKTLFGSYMYKILLFGLIGGPSLWQRLMNDILFEYLNDFCAVYLDDILIYSKTLKEHKEQVNKVLDKLIEAGLQVDIEKSKFHVQETAFLGVIIGINSVRMDPKKIQAIVDWSIP